MEYIEISAKTLDDAITKACIDLGISSDNLDYKVISEGSSGFLGIGSKPAIIKARRMTPIAEDEMSIDSIIHEPAKAEAEKKEAEKKQPEKKQAEKKVPEKKQPDKKAEPKKEIVAEAEGTPAPKKEERVITPKTPEEVEKIKETAKVFLDDVFKSMEMEVAIEMEYNQEEGCLDVEFTGPEMGILIGKRGQTLDSLQYLTSLVVNKGQNEYIRIKLDTENYRKRRKDTLENLAKNIAFKVKKTRRPVALEPMNPYERRIIHSALQNNKFVKTFSEGEEPFRHVIVTLKK